MEHDPDQQRATVTTLAVVTLLLGVLALATPLSHTEYPQSSVGGLLAVAAAIEVLHALRRSTTAGRRHGTSGAIISMAIALFLINAPMVAAQSLRRLIVARTPWWKRPVWWWTRAMGAWPFTPEWLSAAFDYNVAPFFQSFVKVTVERSSNRLRLVPYGIHGRLTWGELATSDALRASGTTSGTLAEWLVPMSSVAH